MKKFIVILLVAFFAVGITSCAEDFTETDPIIPEVNMADDAPANEESKAKRRGRNRVTTTNSSTSTKTAVTSKG